MKTFRKNAYFFLPLLLSMGSACAHSNLSARKPAQASNAKICTITDSEYGAKGNGQVETTAIQAAVDACKDVGGIVVVPAGKFISGMIRLGSNMTFRISSGATLMGVGDKNGYPFLNPPTTNGQLLNCRRAFLYAEKADNLTIEGPGTLDANGEFENWKNIQPTPEDNFPIANIFKEAQRPMAIFVVQGNNLNLQNLQMKNAAMWGIVLMETQGANVSSLNINTPIGNSGGTRDGIDIVDGENVHLDNLIVLSEDDSICLKSGLASSLKHVWVSNSHINGSSVANGIKFGTASVGVLEDIHFDNIQIQHVAQAAMAIESVDGSQVDSVTFSKINYSDTGVGIFVLLGWRGNPANAKPGSIANLQFQDIVGTSSKQAWGSAISGSIITDPVTHVSTTYSLNNITFQNVKMTFKGNGQFTSGNLPGSPPEYSGQYPDPSMWPNLPSEGLYFRHVNNITLANTPLMRIPSGDKRPILLPHTGLRTFDAP